MAGPEKREIKGRFFLSFLLIVCLPGVLSEASGKVYYGTEEGAGVHVSVPLGNERVRVRRVIDGDTIELENGEHVRYIGIDTPEERRREGKGWRFDPEPYAVLAAEENRKLVAGKAVRLEFDEEKQDRFGRELAYVYVPIGLFGDARYDGEVRLDSHEIFVNAFLVQRGLARPLTIPPNTRYASRFEKLARDAERQGLGLFGPNKKEIHARER